MIISETFDNIMLIASTTRVAALLGTAYYYISELIGLHLFVIQMSIILKV